MDDAVRSRVDAPIGLRLRSPRRGFGRTRSNLTSGAARGRRPNLTPDSTALRCRIAGKGVAPLCSNGTPRLCILERRPSVLAVSGIEPLLGQRCRGTTHLAICVPAHCYFMIGLKAFPSLENETRRAFSGRTSAPCFAFCGGSRVGLLFSQYLMCSSDAVVPLIAVIHLAMRSWTGRIEDAEKHVATVDRLYLSTIGALSTAIEAKDGVTSMHIHRVQHYAMGLANALGSLDELSMKALQAAALLHDTCKLAVRSAPQKAGQADAG